MDLLKSAGLRPEMEKENPLAVSTGPERKDRIEIPYRYDVYFEINDEWAVAIEPDGTLGHSTSQALGQDRLRDEAGLQKRPKKRRVLTIRLPTSWIVGDGALGDSDIMDEIRFHCKANGIHILGGQGGKNAN